jgi:hypothetical protein
MSEWHSEQERRPWEEDKNFPISIHQERFGRVSFVDWAEEYADPSRKKRTKKSNRETFNILLFIIGIIIKSISLGLSMNHCSPSAAFFLAFGFPKVGKSFSFPVLNIFRANGKSFFHTY